jgi:site-specific recombinase XerD
MNMACKKSERIEAGIWRRADADGYLAEVSYNDQQTGRRIREQKTTNRLDLAREWRQTRKADALRGEIRGKGDRLKPVRFEKFADEYLEQWSKVKKKPSTYKRDQTSLRRLMKNFGKKHLIEITRRDIEQYLAERKTDSVTPATSNRELCCLKNMLRKAVDWEYLKANPAMGVKQQKEHPPEFTFLTDAEIVAFLDSSAPHLRVLFTLAVNTGLRRGELFNLEWRDVDFNAGEGGMLTLRDTKNHDTRHVPMNRIVRESLHSHPKRIVDGKLCPLVFSRKDGGPHTCVRRGFLGAIERAGIDRHVRFHDLRHTFASHLAMRSVDLRTIAQLMGHRDIKMTMRYAHLAPAHLQQAVSMLEMPLPRADGQQAESAA